MTFKDKTEKHVSADAFVKLKRYVELIEEYNKVMNLTGFKEDRLWEEGIFESLASLETAFGKGVRGKLLDIGAGAGFPSVPYLITNPELELTIFEPQQKRIKFLSIVKEELDLNINLINTRVEDFYERQVFDFVTARAVSSLKNLLEAGAHVAKIGGSFGFIKGPRYKDEMKDAAWVLKDLGYDHKIIDVKLDNKETWIVKIDKTQEAKRKYPKTWKEIVS